MRSAEERADQASAVLVPVLPIRRDPRLLGEDALSVEYEGKGFGDFKLVAEGNFWRNPSDPRDFSTQQPTGPLDNFVLKFQKPL